MSPSARLAESSNKTKCASYGLHVFALDQVSVRG